MTMPSTTLLLSVVLSLLLLSRIPAATCAASSSVLGPASSRRFITRWLRPWRRPQEDDYTPLLFFTIPRGLMPECDAMDDAVRQVERELRVRVERMDVLRQPANEAVLQLITQQQRTPPFLYHRESCQSVYLTPAQQQQQPAAGSKKKRQRQDVYVNKDRIRAWAKGRYLMGHSVSAASVSMTEDGMAAKKVTAPQLLPTNSGNEDSGGAMDQAELLEEMALTPEQLKGKRLIEERTKAKAKQNKEKK